MFAHLNTHSYYSLGRGTASPEVICQSVKDMGCKTLAITDVNNICGLMFFIDYAHEFGLKPVVAAEIIHEGVHTTLLVRNKTGYSNLCRIITEHHIKDDFSLIKSLANSIEGLILLSDDPYTLEQLHGECEYIYAELCPGAKMRDLLRLSEQLDIKPVATNRSYWVNKNDNELHRLLRAIHLNSTLTDLPSEECASMYSYLMNENEMREYFSFCPEAVDNTLKVADLCNWTPDFGVVYPEVEPGLNGQSIEILRKKVYEGALRRYGVIDRTIDERLRHELNLIENKGYAPVFLVVEDVVKQSSLTCGRGSAAASVISYCLGITHVDPIKHKLYFERFISPVRKDPPDIDVDFAWDERDDVLDYIFEKYGVENSAMVSNHVSFQKRAAIRETAKVYGLPSAEISAVTKRVSYGFSSIGIGVKDHPALTDHGFPPPWDEILAWAERLDGIPRHMSVHCGGVVITPGKTWNWVPTEIAAKGVRIIQWEKDQTEDSGLVKIDILGNRSLAVIRDTLNKIKECYGDEISYAALNPLDDPKTQALLARGDTMGVFYVESPATRLLQKKAGVGDYEHLVLHSSIIRPAANPFIHDYLRRLKGESYEPLHPLIGDLLEDNYGIMVYQEDVTRVAMKLAGFDFADGEELRKIISKKHKHRRLADLREQFYTGARKQGATDEALDKIWDMIMSFAGYSFCKPHSASYALVSFKSAYLRAHYPAEFISSVISNQGGFYSTLAYVSEARRMGLKLLPLDINESEIRYTGSDDWVRVGLMQIKGLNSDSIARIVEIRRKKPYRSFEDCQKRAELHPSDSRLLIKAGCFDRLEPNRTRPELLWQLILNRSSALSKGQNELFEMPIPTQPKPPEYDERTMLHQEVETLGFLVSKHPLELYKDQLKQINYVKAVDLEKHVGERIQVIGWLVTGKVVTTKNREPMEFVTFEDTSSLIEATFFPQAFKKFSHILSYVRPYRLIGLVEEDFGAVTLTVDKVAYL